MFTGIIESTGKVVKLSHSLSNLELYVKADFLKALQIDQSIAHNGVCLTVDQCNEDSYRCTLIQETLSKSNFNFIQVGDSINLERSVRADARMDGHFVQGHVDGVAICSAVQELDGSWYYTFNLPYEFRALIVLKGSICINGVSLTVSSLSESVFGVSIIPYTYLNTNFQQLKTGDRVNLEFDILGKYIQRLMDIRYQDLLR